ncbi:MAG TPA: TIGR00282 family metallophosphoesterase [Rhodospirillaceae bacterium]|nr:TIGR00282 family metallophosphoesterase [Rhodospirillaceae bacterium]
MRILFFGDVMGRSGRDGLAAHLPAIKDKLNPDVIIVNGENAAAGHGITAKIAQDFFALGVHCITTGNHVFKQKELVMTIDQEGRLLRPLNFPEGTMGHGSYLHALPDGRKILIANIMGQLGMTPMLDDPFACAERLVSQHRLGGGGNGGVSAIFVDFHAETTSEKVAMGHHLDGRVSAVIGTHTHIPTADEQVLAKGTAYQTDTGMCGDFDSVIGMKKENILWRFTRKTPNDRMSPAEGEATLCGVFITTNDATGLASDITAIQIGGRLKARGT